MKYILKIALILVMACSPAVMAVCNGQGPDVPAFTREAGEWHERIFLFTDRSFYAVNETIRISAVLLSEGKPVPVMESKIIYVELVNSSGNMIRAGKFRIDGNAASACLAIPPVLPSGYYYLRSYTKWMRNSGPETYSYVPLRIINPYSMELDRPVTSQGKPGLSEFPCDKGGIALKMAKTSCLPGETLEVDIQPGEDGAGKIEHACITVIPEGSIKEAVYRADAGPANPGSGPFTFHFLPEISGSVISGRLVNYEAEDDPSKFLVCFSILGDDPLVFVAEPDLSGNFSALLPERTGDMELYVTATGPAGKAAEVVIEESFSAEALPFRADTLFILPGEKEMADRISLNMQLEKIYRPGSTREPIPYADPVPRVPFYGMPTRSIDLDEFINLPDVQEIFENLVPEVSVHRKKGEPVFRVISRDPSITWLSPLVLLDNIPVFDHEKILDLQPSRLDNIDVVADVYIIGNKKFGGIISISTKKGDLAGFGLPDGSYFFDYPGIHPPDPVDDLPDHRTGNIPDTRNTLYWEDGISLEKDKPFSITFPAGMAPGNYIILARGISDGRIRTGTCKFTVVKPDRGQVPVERQYPGELPSSK